MITLALFKQLAQEGVAGLVEDTNFFWEEAPLQRDGNPAQGVWIVTRGGDSANSPKGLNLRETIDFYVAFKNKVKTEQVQQAILEWIIRNPTLCSLTGTEGGYSWDYSNVRIRPTTTPQNSGVTENLLIVKMASIQVTYDINS